MLWSTLLFVNAKIAAGIDQDCFISLPCVGYFSVPGVLSRWFSRKLVFLLFYNADIIPVSKFLYFFFFLDRATHATVTHLSANTTVLQP